MFWFKYGANTEIHAKHVIFIYSSTLPLFIGIHAKLNLKHRSDVLYITYVILDNHHLMGNIKNIPLKLRIKVLKYQQFSFQKLIIQIYKNS